MRGPDKQLEEKTGKYAKHSAGGHKDKAVKQTDKEKKRTTPPPPQKLNLPVNVWPYT